VEKVKSRRGKGQRRDAEGRGKSGIRPEMAIRLSKAFGSTAETWLRMQLAYGLAAARKNESNIKVRRQHVEELHV
jgi:plasmid maintenance system antidote protein VapI